MMRFSVSTQGFYPDTIDYGSTLPADVVPITDEQYSTFLKALNMTQNTFVRVYSDAGVLTISEYRPTPYHTWDDQNNKWVINDEGLKSQKVDQVQFAAQMKAELMAGATKQIDPLQDAIDLDMATDEEKMQLTAWRKYRVLLNRVDTFTAPDITWPSIPV
ncbi:tail fiber assembly protein [Pantoea ananatis]|uniref:tail fiber assembly protein n=1 Tax=Pantoea ananas TaxID=553 RepID=UPI001059E89C|nr:tail fiber assembly protein [Pantoea ananatis]TDL54693.1 tail fiber assembly protein [Pantoea ananatis]